MGRRVWEEILANVYRGVISTRACNGFDRGMNTFDYIGWPPDSRTLNITANVREAVAA